MKHVSTSALLYIGLFSAFLVCCWIAFRSFHSSQAQQVYQFREICSPQLYVGSFYYYGGKLYIICGDTGIEPVVKEIAQ